MGESDGPTSHAARHPGPAAPAPETELSRLRAAAAVHQRFRDVTAAFSRGGSTTLSLDTTLHTLAVEANALLGARRTSVWLHQRRSHDLALAASSDAGAAPAAGSVSTGDTDAPPAQGLRLDRPRVIPADGDLLLLAPLRGWRRALGTLVAEGPFSNQLDPPQLLDVAHELSRQLSTAIENTQLLEEIIRQRRLLEDTFDSLVDLVVVTDEALRVVQMNDAFITRVGIPRAGLLERPIQDLIGAELAAWISSADRADAAPEDSNAPRTRRFDDPRLDGTFAVTMTPLGSVTGIPAGHVIVARDITHQTRLEGEREALRARLSQSEKLASLGQFVAGIAHEMNNPLQGVLGHLELLMDSPGATPPVRRELRRIYQDADRAAKIVRNLMVFTGARRMARRRLRLPRILSRALASRSAALARAGIEVVRHEAADLPQVMGDPLLLHQAFLNILMNAEHAIQSTGGGGRIEARFSPDAESGRVIATIRDTGPGIPPDVLPRLFDPFFTTKEVGQGTGLGLAITYGIVQEHGGSIHGSNAPDGGAILTIELPASGASPHSRGGSRNRH